MHQRPEGPWPTQGQVEPLLVSICANGRHHFRFKTWFELTVLGACLIHTLTDKRSQQALKKAFLLLTRPNLPK